MKVCEGIAIGTDCKACSNKNPYHFPMPSCNNPYHSPSNGNTLLQWVATESVCTLIPYDLQYLSLPGWICRGWPHHPQNGSAVGDRAIRAFSPLALYNAGASQSGPAVGGCRICVSSHPLYFTILGLPSVGLQWVAATPVCALVHSILR